jgi:lysophospholipase L1-like esterase
MRKLLISAIALALLLAPLHAQSITPQIGGGIGQFDGGISGKAGTASTPGFHNFTGSNLSQFVAASAAVAAQTRNGTVMALGDSTTAGADPALDSNYYATSYPVQLAALMGWATDSMMDNVAGNGASLASLQAWDSRLSGTAANWAGDGNQSLIGQLWQPSNTTAFTFTPANPIDTVEIRTTAYAAGSTTPFLANFDGGTNTSISNVNATAILRTTILSTTLGSHAINLSVSSATGGGGQQFNSFVAYNSAVKKFNMLNCGSNGALVTNIVGSGVAWSTLNAITGWPADLVIIMIGVNDWVNGTSLSTYLTDLNLVIAAAKAGGASVIIMSPVPSQSTITAYAVQATYVATMRSAALAAGVPFLDLWHIAGGTWNTGIPMSDSLHPTVTGYGMIASLVKRGLQPGFRSR